MPNYLFSILFFNSKLQFKLAVFPDQPNGEKVTLLLAELNKDINVSESDDSTGLFIANCNSDICDYSSTLCFTDFSSEDYNIH